MLKNTILLIAFTVGLLFSLTAQEEVRELPNGLFIAQLNDLYGVVDSLGKILLNFEYEAIDHCNMNASAVAKYQGEWCAIKDGKRVYDPEEIVFQNPEQPPLYGDCGFIQGTPEELKACSDKAMLMQIFTSIKYPKHARENGIEGMVIVSYVLSENGEILHPEVIQQVGGGCDEEAIRLVKLLNDWSPGVQDGIAVKTRMKMPIKYRLE